MAASYPRFDPPAINVTRGQPLQISLTARDVDHTFTIDELQVNVPIRSGTPAIAQFTPTRTGTFVLYCAIHGRSVMRATFSVLEPGVTPTPVPTPPPGATPTPSTGDYTY